MRIFIIAIFLMQSALAATQWSVQITDPDYELKNVPLDDKELKLYLPRTSWRCWPGATQTKDDREWKEVRCNYSVEKSGEFKVVAMCTKERPYNEIKIELVDERKDLTFQLLVICRK